MRSHFSRILLVLGPVKFLRFRQDPDEVVVHHLERVRGVAHALEGQRAIVAGVLLHHLPAAGMLELIKDYE